MIDRVLKCNQCENPVLSHGARLFCRCKSYSYTLVDGVYCKEEYMLHNEAVARDEQADKYLLHPKFPTQIARFMSWLDSIPDAKGEEIALDLCCGPGPFTRMLMDKGYFVVGIDFSENSLIINSKSCVNDLSRATFISDDINNIVLQEKSNSIVVMADFLQHIGGRTNRERLLSQVFKSLVRNGKFYLSFFNINIKNYVKGDIHGSFSNGQILYERLIPKNVARFFSDSVHIEKIYPMNIVQNAVIDNVLTALPMAMYFSRMAVIEGKIQ